jgi:hypothetical protein
MDAVRRLLVVLVTTVGLVVLGPSTAYACDCATATPRSALGYADVVVEAAVVQKDEPEQLEGMDVTRYLLEVRTVHKGEATERLEFASNYSGAACGLEGVEVGHRGMFFLYRPTADGGYEPDAALVANLCGGSMRITQAQVERVTGPGSPPRSDASPVAAEPREDVRAPADPGRSRWPAYAGGAALMLLGAGWWVLRRRPV